MNIILLGTRDTGGAYVLRIAVNRNLKVRFGRFQNGHAINVPAGVYVYVGSAMGSDQTLRRRVVRHATRSNNRKPHGIRDNLINMFGVEVLPKGKKKLHWHIDFLLDRSEVNLTHVIMVHSAQRLEEVFAEQLMADVSTSKLAKGLGATDARGHTHLLRVPEKMDWWSNLAKLWETINLMAKHLNVR
jgi:Uri superfamily endonuclease